MKSFSTFKRFRWLYINKCVLSISFAILYVFHIRCQAWWVILPFRGRATINRNDKWSLYNHTELTSSRFPSFKHSRKRTVGVAFRLNWIVLSLQFNVNVDYLCSIFFSMNCHFEVIFDLLLLSTTYQLCSIGMIEPLYKFKNGLGPS